MLRTHPDDNEIIRYCMTLPLKNYRSDRRIENQIIPHDQKIIIKHHYQRIYTT